MVRRRQFHDGLLLPAILTFLPANRAVGLYIDFPAVVSSKLGPAMGWYTARRFPAAGADPDLYLSEHGRT